MPMTPLELTFDARPLAEVDADVLVLPFATDGAAGPGTGEALAAAGLNLDRVLAAHGRRPDPGAVYRVPVAAGLRAQTLALVCVPAGELDLLALRHAAVAAGRACADDDHAATTLQQLAGGDGDAVAAVADGLAWGRYRFLDYKRTTLPVNPGGLTRVALLGPQGAVELPAGLGSGTRLAIADWVRDMVNTPAREATPAAFAAEACRVTSHAGISCRIWSKDDLAAAGFGAIVAVGSGSANEPCMLEMRYEGGDGPRIALAGKGITYDAGGLELKSSNALMTMKDDMAGAAAVVGATWAAAELGLNVNLVTVAPLAENMPSGTAMRPGDVITHPDGSTTEMLSPDSEGRLVLADALAYLARDEFDAIVDVATLTGDTALGSELWAILGTDDGLVRELIDAGARTGDPGWQLPLWRSYERYLKSQIADGRNSADWMSYKVGTIMGALYLRRFVGDRPWVHIDTAATANRTGDIALDWCPLGATGSPIGPLVSWLEARAA